MKINFTYSKDKDIWCLLNKGKSSHNSERPTMQYEQLVSEFGDSPTEENVAAFIDTYISKHNIDISGTLDRFQKEWNSVSAEFQKRAEAIFGVTIPSDITAYLTINIRSPYSISGNHFYVSVQAKDAIKTIFHELWHFYTWYGLGEDQEEKIGKRTYNDLKEALTVLLNVECSDLLSEGGPDMGYPQHSELREKILEYWKKDKNINNLWNYLLM